MRSVVVTGTGIVSALGEGTTVHLEALRSGRTGPVDRERFAPYVVHPVVPLEWDRQIAKKSDQRQMEGWQKLGCYAAGLALEQAGARDDAALKASTHLIVAAGGGERDEAADGQILTGLRQAAEPGAFLNERLMGDLRPTLFLAQLSNMLAGNIAIVHGVTGASRTFMGEEAAGIDALRVAQARIAAGQADIILVGGSYNADRTDVLLMHEMGGLCWQAAFRPVFERGAPGGFILGSGGAFLVLEADEHASARGIRPLARMPAVKTTRSRREPGDVGRSLDRLWAEAEIGPDAYVLSGATGISEPTGEERDALARLAPGASVHATGDLVGHMMEAHAAAGAVLAVALVSHRDAPEAAVTAVGHHRGEGVARFVGTH
jgi:3-oxoacyl-[acyl-carrier-protein] synthase II